MPINEFSQQYSFLSNFYESPIFFAGKIWPTVEHLYQALKTHDEVEQERIRLCPTPDEAKQQGRKIKLFYTWEIEKENAMLACVRLKFQQNKLLQDSLIATGESYLIEGNTWHDNIWGDCCCDDCKEIPGKNLLGKILMQVRSELNLETAKLTLMIPSPSSRLFPQVSEFLRSKGIKIEVTGKKLAQQFNHLEIIYARGFDIPTAIDLGLADIGITGEDAVYESQARVKILNYLGIRFSEVVLLSRTLNHVRQLQPYDIVVTEYDKITKEYFRRHNIYNLNFLPVTGAAEAYSFLPEVAAIVTLKTSGQAIQDNQLNIVDTLFKTQACLIANPLILQTKAQLVMRFSELLQAQEVCI